MKSSGYNDLLEETNLEQLFECKEKTFGIQVLKSESGFFICFDEQVFGPFISLITCMEKLAECYLIERQENYDRYVEIHELAEKWGKA